MKKTKNILLLLSLLLLPGIAYASGESDAFPPGMAIFMELFVTIHMTIFVLLPLSRMIFKDNPKKGFWKLFIARAAILLFFDAYITTSIAAVDFIMVFIGAFIIVPICAAVTKTNINSIYSGKKVTPVTNNMNISNNTFTANTTNLSLKCTKCQSLISVSDNFCPNCGAPIAGDNISVSENTNTLDNSFTQTKMPASLNDFDPIFSLDENAMLEEFITREIAKIDFDKEIKLIPEDIIKRKIILNTIFSILVFVFISLIFLHFPIYTYIIGIVILFVFFRVTRKYNLIKYIKKQLKARPSEKISNIIMNVKTSSVKDNTKSVFLVTFLVAIILPITIFMSPKILYEEADGGYAVRFYAFGITNFKTATIPDEYNGKKVVSLRGNTFSNMPFLEEVILPDSITEIRGQAFKNDGKLLSVKLPSNLEYLGGGAFYNCKSLQTIELPDTLTYLGGESFYGASSLKSVKLSENLTEIRGDSFEYCTSLESIIIPDKVTRIGGHAFYGDSALSGVYISENSMLKEIGSSAFRACPSLYSITVPKSVLINQRAFKESPTKIYYYENYTNDNYYYNYGY